MQGGETIIDVPESVMKGWQELVDVLAQLLEIPAALIMRLNGEDIEVFVSSNTAGNPYRAGDREHFAGSGLYCEAVIKSREKLLIPDALADEQWRNNPDIKLDMSSYLGFPILLPDKKPFGTLCVLDNKANSYSKTAETLMSKFRSLLESQLELLYANRVLGDRNRRLTDYMVELQALRGMVPICANCKSIQDPQGHWRPIEHYLVDHPDADFSHGMCPACMAKLYPGFNAKP